MHRIVPYTLLLVVLALLQTFLFDRLLLSAEILPVVYIAFIALLPMRCSQLEMLMWGVLVGGLFDILMGMSGLNLIATLFVCYTRCYLLNLTLGREVDSVEIPTPRVVGMWKFFRYIVVVVLIHSTILFAVESFNFDSMLLLLRRIVLSSLVALPFVWIISRRFEQLLLRK